MNARPTQSSDIPFLTAIVDATRLFPSEMLGALTREFLSDSTCEDIWLTCEMDGKPVGFCYAGLEPLTDGAWNMRAIAVHPSWQGRGVGAALVKEIEGFVRKRDGRVLIADTSSASGFERTRAFYKRIGYAEEARIREFWSVGQDKIVFWKGLG
jgi:GNAT superfamily N-acetyltransferase